MERHSLALVYSVIRPHGYFTRIGGLFEHASQAFTRTRRASMLHMCAMIHVG